MKKVLILTTSTGYGHNLAASSTKDILNDGTKEVIIYDFLQPNKLLNSSIVNGYELCANSLGNLYGILYKLSNVKVMNKVTNRFFHCVRKNLLNYINNYCPDLIIATHPLSISMLSYLKKQRLIKIPILCIVTDFKAHYTYVSKEIDAYITPSIFTKEDLIKKGIKHNRIHPIGIPVRKDFYTNVEKVNFDTHSQLKVLLMGGGMGLKSISSVLEHIISNNNIAITVICGKNVTLKNHLHKLYSNYIGDKLTIIGYTSKVSDIMKCSDLLITKPGGLTTTEALISQLPMLIPFIIPGQESENREFLIKSNCALSIKNLTDINDVISKLSTDSIKLSDMKKSMKNISSNYCPKELINLCNELIHLDK